MNICLRQKRQPIHCLIQIALSSNRIIVVQSKLQFVAILWLLTSSLNAVGHEGHQPLPTKGVQVDLQKGQITLSGRARDTIGLQSAEVVVGTVTAELKVYAETVAPWQAKAFGSAQIAGRIAKLMVRPGDFVEKNQVVAELSSRELEAIKLDYIEASNELSLHERLLAMTRPSAQAGAIPMQRLLELQNALERSRNRLDVARIRALTLGVTLEGSSPAELSGLHYPIRSPIAGRVIHSDLAEGKYVESFEHLVEIVNTDQVWIRLQLLEKDIVKASVGNRVNVSFPNSSLTFDGVVERIDASLDPQTQVSWAWMTVAHPAMIPGLVGSATIYSSEQADRIAVPQRSIYSDGLQSYVFVEEAATRNSAEYRKKNVKLGKRRLTADQSSEPMLEVLQGDIYPGDRVVVTGGHELSSLFFLGVLKLSDSDQERLGIVVSPATHREIRRTIHLPASVTFPPENRGVLSSQLAGTVHSHALSPGRAVRAGEVLLEIASPEFHRLQLDLLTASLDAALSRHRAERLEEVKGDGVSMRIVVETRAQAEQLETRAESIKRQLVTLGLLESEVDLVVKDQKLINYLPIRSNIDGLIASSAVTLGETVAANQPLVEIHNLDVVWLEAHLPAGELGAVSSEVGGTAAMLANPEVKFPVVLSRIGPVMNQSTRTQRIWLVPKPTSSLPQLRAGTLMAVTLALGDGVSTLAVPTSAILRDGLHFFTFVRKDDDYIERRRVVVGRSDGEYVEIVDGVAAGELVVSTGGRDLQTAFASLR
jgi:membrane fusion protein, heavy metal efflux system